MNDSGVRAILSDFDGVLVDSEPLRYRAGVQALSAVGVKLIWEMFADSRLGRSSPQETTLAPNASRNRS